MTDTLLEPVVLPTDDVESALWCSIVSHVATSIQTVLAAMEDGTMSSVRALFLIETISAAGRLQLAEFGSEASEDDEVLLSILETGTPSVQVNA